jgi:hypothetical protein
MINWYLYYKFNNIGDIQSITFNITYGLTNNNPTKEIRTFVTLLKMVVPV